MIQVKISHWLRRSTLDDVACGNLVTFKVLSLVERVRLKLFMCHTLINCKWNFYFVRSKSRELMMWLLSYLSFNDDVLQFHWLVFDDMSSSHMMTWMMGNPWSLTLTVDFLWQFSLIDQNVNLNKNINLLANHINIRRAQWLIYIRVK